MLSRKVDKGLPILISNDCAEFRPKSVPALARFAFRRRRLGNRERREHCNPGQYQPARDDCFPYGFSSLHFLLLLHLITAKLPGQLP